MIPNLKKKSFLKLLDFSPMEIHFLLKLAGDLKKEKYAGLEEQRLKGKNIALIFEKTSTPLTFISPILSQVSIPSLPISSVVTKRVAGKPFSLSTGKATPYTDSWTSSMVITTVFG